MNRSDTMDDYMMNELKHLARNGSLTAALFLKDHYKDKDVDMEYRYTCYSALAGDLNSAIELYNSDMKVMRAFVDDCTVDDLLRFNEIPIEHIESHGDKMFAFGHDKDWKGYRGESNEGYIHPKDAGFCCVFDPHYENPAFIIRRFHPELAEEYPRKDYKQEKDVVEFKYTLMSMEPTSIFESTDESIACRFWRAMFRYLGIGVERDGERALREMLELSESGDKYAANAVAFLVGYQPESFRQRYPMYSDKDLRRIEQSPSYRVDDPRRFYYEVADRSLIQDSVEWMILSLITGIDSYGFTSIEDKMNDEGGYDDDIICTHRDRESEIRPPTFIFKPSGYSMGWYKYAWRSPEQNENLSVGEILRLWRLCIEHILWGKEMPSGTTKEILELPIDTVPVPNDLKGRVESVCDDAMCNYPGLSRRTSFITFDEDSDDYNEKRAKKILGV